MTTISNVPKGSLADVLHSRLLQEDTPENWGYGFEITAEVVSFLDGLVSLRLHSVLSEVSDSYELRGNDENQHCPQFIIREGRRGEVTISTNPRNQCIDIEMIEHNILNVLHKMIEFGVHIYDVSGSRV